MKNFIFVFSLFSALMLAACQERAMQIKYGSSENPSPLPVRPKPTGTVVPTPNDPNSLKGTVAVPTAEAIVARIQRGLEGSATIAQGNFRTSYGLVSGGLPKDVDPRKASGFDQVQLLVYAACSDLTTGTTPVMSSKYGINPTATIVTNQSALIKAGIRMMDQYVAGLASQSSVSDQVTALFTKLVTDVAAVSGNTTRHAFMAVCIAANTAGSTMMGF
jgi:hypothetical protein